MSRFVYIVDGQRTPFLKARTERGPYTASDLAVRACQTLLLRHSFPKTALGELICGCVMPSADEANIARLVALRLGLPESMPAWTVQRNCASGLQAIDSAMLDILSGRHELVLAGGTEAMSHAPLMFPPSFNQWLGRLQGSKSLMAKLLTFLKFRPSFLKPVIALLKGLTDPLIGLSMGQTAEELAYRFGITRAQMDEWALASHHKAASARDLLKEEAVPLFEGSSVQDHDDGVRPDVTLEKLKTLKPFFDKRFGQVTPGNSSQITDGAAFLLLASEKAVRDYQLPVLARIVDVAWGGCDPKVMGLGPVHAIAPLLSRSGLDCSSIDLWEINEAFSAQVLACVAALDSPEYCQDVLGLSDRVGAIPLDRLNVSGGAIALGHPVGASGARVVLHLAKLLRRHNKKRGVASLCIGGGQGGALLMEHVNQEVLA